MSAAPVLDLSAAEEFFAGLYATAEDGWLSIYSRSDKGTATDWAPVTDPALAAFLALGRAHDSNVWFGVATRKERLGRKRGGAEDCLALPALYADLDIAGPNHKTELSLPSTVDEALELAHAIGLAPSIVTHSGGGLQVYWLFQEMQDAAELVEAGVLRRWQATLERLAGERGWHVDNVSDVPRVLRVPGTSNFKQADLGIIEPARILTADYERRYGLDDLLEMLDAPAAKPAAPAGRPALPYVGPERPGDAFAMSNTGSDVLRSLGWEYVKRDRNGDDYWRRPGSSSPHSAIVHYKSGQTAIFSEEVVARYPALESAQTGATYNAFGLYAAMMHGGDHGAAAAELRRQGYGSASAPPDLSWVADEAEVEEEDDQAAEEEWRTPDSFEPTISHGPTFPLSVLPAWMADHVAHTARALSAPTDYAAITGLGVLSALVMNRLWLNLTGTDRARMGVNLYLLAAGTSGAMKSPSFDAMAGVLHDIIAERAERNVTERARAELVLKQAEETLANVEKAPTTSQAPAARIDELIRARVAVEEAKSAMPPEPDILADDATPEALAVHVRDCGEIAALMSPEGELVEMVAGQYAEKGKTPNLGIYIKSYDGERYSPKRIGRESFTLRSPRMTVCAMTQPGILAQMGRNNTLTDKGLVARFLMAVPASNTGWVDHSAQLRRSPEARQARQVYEARMTQLARQLDAGETAIATAPETSQAYVEWAQGVEARMRKGGDLRPLEGWVRKLLTATLRTTALLHVAHGHDASEPISVATFEMAATLADYWIDHAKAVWSAWADARAKSQKGEAERAQKLVVWALDEHDGGEVPWAEIRKRLKDSYRLKAADMAPIVEYLVETGWARVPAGFFDRLARNTRGDSSLTVTFHPDAAEHLAGTFDEAPDLGLADAPVAPELLAPVAPEPFAGSSTESAERGHWGNGDRGSSYTTTTNSVSKGTESETSVSASDAYPCPQPPVAPDLPEPSSTPPSVSDDDFGGDDDLGLF